MDAKEKAGILVAKFIKHSRAEKDIKPIQSAKQCALIAVDEIEDAIDFDWMEVQNLESQHRYWQKVKEEIEKL